jgi:hypothetical protein
MAMLIIWEHSNFNPDGDNKVLYHTTDNFADIGWNDKVSSFEVVSGVWQFWSDKNSDGWGSKLFGPGKYASVEEELIANDSVSSVFLYD